MNLVIGVMIGVGFGYIVDYLVYRRTGETNTLGVFILTCKDSKNFGWLGMYIWGDDDWYFNAMRENIRHYKAST